MVFFFFFSRTFIFVVVAFVSTKKTSIDRKNLADDHFLGGADPCHLHGESFSNQREFKLYRARTIAHRQTIIEDINDRQVI